MIENEIAIMRSCNHPNIVKLHEEFETKEHVYLVTDLVKVIFSIIDRKYIFLLKLTIF